MNLKVLSVLLISMYLLITSCSNCNDEIVPFEGFDIAVVDDLKESLIGPNKRYQLTNISLMVEGSNIIYGHYKKDDLYFLLVDYSGIKTTKISTDLKLADNYGIPFSFEIRRDNSHCFPHNKVSELNIDGEEYEVTEQILVFQ